MWEQHKMPYLKRSLRKPTSSDPAVHISENSHQGVTEGTNLGLIHSFKSLYPRITKMLILHCYSIKIAWLTGGRLCVLSNGSPSSRNNSTWDLFLLSTGIYQISTVCPRSQHWVPVSLSFFFGWKDQISFHIWTVLGKIKDSLSLDNFRCYSCSKYWPSPLLLPPFPHDTVPRALAMEK